jgi:glucose-6-phosphate 1-epimerase
MPDPLPLSAETPSDPAALNRAFSADGAVRFDHGPHGMVRATLHSADGEAEVYLHGAQATGWIPRGQAPVLFLSSKSFFTPTKPIRGGVPICFPWFGPHAEPARGLPMHGFARLRQWQPLSATRGGDGSVTLVLGFASDDATRALFPADFRAAYAVTLGKTLEMALTVTNPGAAAFTATGALHTYLHVGDARQVKIHGLGGGAYVDKARNYGRFVQDEAVLRLDAYIDRVYPGTAATVAVDDPVLNRRVLVAKEGSQSTVVWNPWSTSTMADLDEGEWQHMLCVEAGAIAEHGMTIAPGASARLATTLSLAPLP